MLKKFFRRKADGSLALDGSYRSPPGPAPYQPVVREASTHSESGHRLFPGDSDSNHSSESLDQRSQVQQRQQDMNGQRYGQQGHSGGQQVQYGGQYGAPQHLAGYQNGNSYHKQHVHMPHTFSPQPSHQQPQSHFLPQRHPPGTGHRAMAGPEPDRIVSHFEAPRQQSVASSQVQGQPAARGEGEVYFDSIPDLQNPNPAFYSEPATAPPRFASGSSQPTVISNVKPFQKRSAPSGHSESAPSLVPQPATRQGGGRESLDGLQQQQLVSSLSRPRAPDGDAHAQPAAAAVPRVLATTTSSASASTPRVLQTTHSGPARGGASAVSSLSGAGGKGSFAGPSIQEVRSTVLCVLGEMEALSPLVRELQITVLKQELSLGKGPKVMERRRRESWPPRLDMDKIRALERSMAVPPSPAGKASMVPAAAVVPASPRAQQDEALGVDSTLPIKGRLAQLRQKWEGKGGAVPLPVLTSSMPKAAPKWSRHQPVRLPAAASPPARVEEEEVEEVPELVSKSSLTIQGLSLAVSAPTPTSPHDAHFPPPTPPLQPPPIPAEQFSFRLPGEAAPDTGRDTRPGGGLGVEPLFKPRAMLLQPLAPPNDPPPPPPPPAGEALSIPDLQLDGLDGDDDEDEAGSGREAGAGLVDSVPEGARGSTRGSSLDSDSRAEPLAPVFEPAALAAALPYHSLAPTPGPDTAFAPHYQPPALAGYAVQEGEGGGYTAEFGAVGEDPVVVPGLAVEDEGAEESVEFDLSSALMSGTLARLNKKIKDFEDGFWVLSCKGSEGHAAGVKIGFAYKLESFDSKRDAAAHAEPTDSLFLQGATVKFVQGTVFKVQTTNELNKKGTTSMMSTNTEREAAEWLAAMELVPDVAVDWVGKDGVELARA